MLNKILVFLEQRDGIIKRSSLEVITKGYSLAKTMSAEIEAITIGDEINLLPNVGKYGVTKITHIKNSSLANYSVSAYTDLLVNFAIKSEANMFLFANTTMGQDIAPALAIKLNGKIIVDCIELEASKNGITATRPIYAGKALITHTAISEKTIFTLRPNSFEITETRNSEAEVVVKLVDKVNLSNRVISVEKITGKLDVSEADIVVAGGRGIGSKENFELVEELALQLKAAIGASRAVVDAGWRPHSEQIGQTGKTISPNLYIAVGISGAVQHLAGMQSSKCIVAINKDKDAPIFNIADYGIVGDASKVVPTLIEELKKEKLNG